MEDNKIDIEQDVEPSGKELETKPCGTCTVEKDDCNPVVCFANLLDVPAIFCSGETTGWECLKISVVPRLNVILEDCIIGDTHLVFTDPCNKSHDIKRFAARVKKARVVGTIVYMVSAQPTRTAGIGWEPAAASTVSAVAVDRTVAFIDDCNVSQVSVVVETKKLEFAHPSECRYGASHALRIKGEFLLHLGYIVNGSFENGFGGWEQTVPPGATADTVHHFDKYDPVEGCYFALLKTDGPSVFNTVRQDFYANAGDKISGWAFFKTNDYMPFNDSSEVALKMGDELVKVLFHASVSTVGNYGQTPWTYFEFIIEKAGRYTIEGSVANALDSLQDSYLGLDDFRLTMA